MLSLEEVVIKKIFGGFAAWDHFTRRFILQKIAGDLSQNLELHHIIAFWH